MEFDFNLSGVSDIRIETDVIKEYELIDGKMQKRKKKKRRYASQICRWKMDL